MRRSIPLLLSFAALAACAPTEGASVQTAAADRPPRQCFTPREVVNFRSDGAQSIYLRTLDGGVYEASSGGCFDIGNAIAVSIAPTMGINDRLCVGDGAQIVSQSSTRPGPCSMRIVNRLTEAQIEALPSRHRP